MEELWVVCRFTGIIMEKVEVCYWWECSDEKNMNKLVEWKVFVDTYGKSADLKNKGLFKSFAAYRAIAMSEGVLRISHLVVVLFRQCISFCNKCKLCNRWCWRRCMWSDQWSQWIAWVLIFCWRCEWKDKFCIMRECI